MIGIGKVYTASTEYYDSKTGLTQRKGRPVLVVGGPKNNDYSVLPISTITKRENVDPDYDIYVDVELRGILSLDRECFIRTHKQMPLHRGSIFKELGNMKDNAPDLYQDVLMRMERFQKEILAQAR